MPLPSRRTHRSEGQPALPLDLGPLEPAPPRPPRSRSRSRREASEQLAFWEEEEENQAAPVEPTLPPEAGLAAIPETVTALADHPSPVTDAIDRSSEEPEPPDFDPDPFAEIPGFVPAPSVTQEFVLLPGSLRSRLDLREFSRFLATLPTVVRDWDGAPEIDDGGIRLRGSEGGAWVYPEASRVRLVADADLSRPVAEDMVALCRWLESRSGMRLYPAGETGGAGVDRSLDAWDAFLDR